MKIIKLSNGLKVKSSEIKSLRDKPVRVCVSFGKEKKLDYSIEFYDNTFTEITKQEYKLIRDILRGEGR